MSRPHVGARLCAMWLALCCLFGPVAVQAGMIGQLEEAAPMPPAHAHINTMGAEYVLAEIKGSSEAGVHAVTGAESAASSRLSAAAVERLIADAESRAEHDAEFNAGMEALADALVEAALAARDAEARRAHVHADNAREFEENGRKYVYAQAVDSLEAAVADEQHPPHASLIEHSGQGSHQHEGFFDDLWDNVKQGARDFAGDVVDDLTGRVKQVGNNIIDSAQEKVVGLIPKGASKLTEAINNRFGSDSLVGKLLDKGVAWGSEKLQGAANAAIDRGQDFIMGAIDRAGQKIKEKVTGQPSDAAAAAGGAPADPSGGAVPPTNGGAVPPAAGGAAQPPLMGSAAPPFYNGAAYPYPSPAPLPPATPQTVYVPQPYPVEVKVPEPYPVPVPTPVPAPTPPPQLVIQPVVHEQTPLPPPPPPPPPKPYHPQKRVALPWPLWNPHLSCNGPCGSRAKNCPKSGECSGGMKIQLLKSKADEKTRVAIAKKPKTKAAAKKPVNLAAAKKAALVKLEMAQLRDMNKKASAQQHRFAAKPTPSPAASIRNAVRERRSDGLEGLYNLQLLEIANQAEGTSKMEAEEGDEAEAEAEAESESDESEAESEAEVDAESFAEVDSEAEKVVQPIIDNTGSAVQIPKVDLKKYKIKPTIDPALRQDAPLAPKENKAATKPKAQAKPEEKTKVKAPTKEAPKAKAVKSKVTKDAPKSKSAAKKPTPSAKVTALIEESMVPIVDGTGSAQLIPKVDLKKYKVKPTIDPNFAQDTPLADKKNGEKKEKENAAPKAKAEAKDAKAPTKASQPSKPKATTPAKPAPTTPAKATVAPAKVPTAAAKAAVAAGVSFLEEHMTPIIDNTGSAVHIPKVDLKKYKVKPIIDPSLVQDSTLSGQTRPAAKSNSKATVPTAAPKAQPMKATPASASAPSTSTSTQAKKATPTKASAFFF